MHQLRSVTLDEIRIDGGTQPRVAISETTVAEYAASIHDGAQLPPIDLFFDGSAYWLADGFHRFHAARHLGLESLTVTVHAGTRRDAVLFAVAANQAHGLRRTNEDKRRAVLTLLKDEEWGKWSDREVARRCGVNHEMVGKARSSLAESASDKSARTYTTKHGTKATMNTEKIGAVKGAARTQQEREDRLTRARQMAAEGYTSRQMAAEFGIGSDALRTMARKHQIDIPADRVVGKVKLHDSNRIVSRIVMDAENLTEGTELVDYTDLNRADIADWLSSLKKSRDRLSMFIRRLMQEQQSNGEAA